MGKIFSVIDDTIADFIRQQQMFFVATAPLSGAGHINVSPKGLDSFRVIDERTVAYVDFVGSGIETIAHLKENGRIIVMFCSFQGAPKILRLHGRGTVLEPGDPDFLKLSPAVRLHSGVRAIVRIDCERISDSCGFGVPLYQFDGHRPHLTDWVDRKGPDGLVQYQREKNAASIDGLPGVTL